MAKFCPPGFICIENMTIIFLIIILILAGLVFYYVETKNVKNNNKDVVYVTENIHYDPRSRGMFPGFPSNILMNPFSPPLKNRDFIPSTTADPRGVPINVNTRGMEDSYDN